MFFMMAYKKTVRLLHQLTTLDQHPSPSVFQSLKLNWIDKKKKSNELKTKQRMGWQVHTHMHSKQPQLSKYEPCSTNLTNSHTRHALSLSISSQYYYNTTHPLCIFPTLTFTLTCMDWHSHSLYHMHMQMQIQIDPSPRPSLSLSLKSRNILNLIEFLGHTWWWYWWWHDDEVGLRRLMSPPPLIFNFH